MIGSSENRISYDGNGIATEFAYTFKILEKSDLFVLHVAIDGTETLLTKDYYVDMEKSVVLYPGYAPGAEIPEAERPPILPVGERLVLYRQVPITQESALDKHWPFSVIEDGLDKLTIICQQIWDRLGRSFYVSESTSTNFNPKVPIEPGKTFRVKDDGTGFEVTEDPGKVIDGATALLEQTTEQAEFAKEQADASSQSAVNAQNAANTAEKIASDLGLVDEAVQTAVDSAEQASNSATTASNKANIATTQANVATAKASEASTSAATATQKADAANTSAANAAQSYANADAIATQLTEYLATKETLTAPAVDKTLLIEGAAADSKIVGELKSDLSEIVVVQRLTKPNSGAQVFPFEFIEGQEYIITNLSTDTSLFIRTCTSDGTAVENIPSNTAYTTPTRFIAGVSAHYVRIYGNLNNVTVTIRTNGELVDNINSDFDKAFKSIGNINRKINPLMLTMKEYTVPTEFKMFVPFKIYTDGINFTSNFNADIHKNVGGNVWYVAPSVTAGNNGETRNSPISFQAAYDKASNGDTIIFLEGEYSRSSGGGYVFSKVIKKSLNLIAEGNGAIFIDGNYMIFSKVDGYTNVYSCSRSLTSRVIDVSVDGKYIPYTKANSISEVDDVAGTYYINGSDVYVHDLNNGDPTGHVVCCLNYEKPLDISNADQNVKVYAENITLVGKYNGVLINKENTNNTLEVCFNNVSTILCGSDESGMNSIGVYGGEVVFNKCKAISSFRDGFNYNGVNKAGVTCDCHCVEIDCIGASCGHEASMENMNGSTCHNGAKIIRINGEYYNCQGPSVADVQQGTQSVNLGCLAYAPYCTSANSINFASSDSGSEMWLFGCLAIGAVADLYCASGSTMHVVDTAYKAKTTIGTFDEVHPRDISEMMLLKKIG